MKATAAQETPIFFRADDNELFGIVTQPSGLSNRAGVVVLAGGTYTPSTGRNRFSVRLCRDLAGLGFHTIRFDYHGIGESTGVLRSYDLEQPFTKDLAGAMANLSTTGIAKTFLVGRCFGARTALALAAEDRSVAGVVLLAVPIRDYSKGERGAAKMAQEWSSWDYVRKALHPRTLRRLLSKRYRMLYRKMFEARRKAASSATATDGWVSEHLLRPLRLLRERGVPVLFIYGTRDEAYKDFLSARDGRLGKLIASEKSTIEVRTLERHIEELSNLESQDPASDLIRNWIIEKHSGEARGQQDSA